MTAPKTLPSFPFKGEVGMGLAWSPQSEPIPTLALPLKGRELVFTAAGFRRDE